MTYFADYLSGLAAPELTEVAAALRLGVFGDGNSIVPIKPNGDGKTAIVNWQHDDATFSYLWHLTAGPNANGALIALGTDRMVAGAGLLIANKSVGAAGISIQNHPGAGQGIYTQHYAKNPALLIEQYAASVAAIRTAVKTGEGISDIVTTQGSKTITSASANFVAGDVGQSLTQLTQVGNLSPSGCIPVGATIASVTNSTTAVMSVNSQASGTGVRARVGGRLPSTGLPVWQMADTDGTTLLWQLLYNRQDQNIPLRITNGLAKNAAIPSISVRAAASGQTGNLFEAANNAASLIYSRIDKNGYIITAKNAAPADADLAAGELASWLDATNGATKIMFKAKSANGTVVTAQLAMA